MIFRQRYKFSEQLGRKNLSYNDQQLKWSNPYLLDINKRFSINKHDCTGDLIILYPVKSIQIEIKIIDMKRTSLAFLFVLISLCLVASEPAFVRSNLPSTNSHLYGVKYQNFQYVTLQQNESENFATNRGSLMLGGGLSFQFRKGVDGFRGKSISLDFEPKVMAFIAPSFAIGGTVITSYYKYEDDSPSTLWGVGPTLSYYIAGHSKKKVYPFLEASFIFTGDEDGYIITYSQFEFGAMFMLSDAVGLTTSLNYRLDIYYPEGAQAEHVNNIFFSVGFRSFIFK